MSNGTLYSITNWSIVFAVDARTGKEKWRWDPEVNQDKIASARSAAAWCSAALALYQNLVIAPVIDGRLIALDAETGKPVWESRVSYSQDGYTITMAPRIAKGKVIIGVARLGAARFADSSTPMTPAPANSPGDFTPCPAILRSLSKIPR